MNTRSKQQRPLSPEPEPQRRARLLQKAIQLDLSEEVLMADEENVYGERRRRGRGRHFYEDEGLIDEEPFEREEYSPIRLPNLPLGVNDWSIKSNVMANLPKFLGVPGENPHNHLKELHNHCEAVKPGTVHIDRAKLKAFPWTLEGTTKIWFNTLTPNSIDTWQQMSTAFLKKF